MSVTPLSSALSESQLRRWLIHEDVYLSRHTREWLKTTPPEVAADMLARIAQDAALESAHPVALFLRGFVLAGFTPSMAILGGSVYDRRAGIRAAILLGRLGDPRAIEPLSRLWTDNRIIKSKYHNDFEAILIHLLRHITPEEIVPYADALYDLLRRIWKSRPYRDLTASETELLLAGLGALPAAARTENAALRSLLNASAAAQPNRKRIQEAAEGETDRAANH